MPRTIRVFEHEHLKLQPNKWGESVTETELKALYAFNDKNDNDYFTGIRDGIKFKSYVGVIQIGGFTLEILPKTDKVVSQSEEERKAATTKWRNALLRMLAVCRRIKVDSVSEASLEKRHHSILDLYFELYLAEVEKLLHLGLIKKYRKTEGNLLALKGRLNFSRNIQQNLIHQERFYTHHQVYDQDHLINHILLRALVILNRITSSPFIKDRLARIKLDFPEIQNVNIQVHHFDQLIENRKTIHYHEAVKIAKMIILNYSPDIKGGSEDMLALIFDMNKLWEEYIYRVLMRDKPEGTTLNFQNSKPFWETENFNKSIRPDLVVKIGNDTFIIDTKWRVINANYPDDGDLKQIFTYNLYWKTYHSILLYPRANHESTFLYGWYKEGLDKEHGCSLAFIDVLDGDGRLNRDCAKQIFDILYANKPQVSARELE